MNDPQLLAICEKENTEALDQLLEDGFQLYLHIDDILNQVMWKDLPVVYEYIIKYIKKHPINQLTKGALYREHFLKIKNYELYLLLKNNPTQDKIYNFLWQIDESRSMVRIQSSLIFKIVSLDLPNNIVDVFRNYNILNIINRVLYVNGPEDIYHSDIEYNQIESSFEVLFCMVNHLGQDMWKTWPIIGPEKKQEIMNHLHSHIHTKKRHHRDILNSAIYAGEKEVYTAIVNFKNFNNMILWSEDYLAACRIGNFDLALQILMGMINMKNITTFSKLKEDMNRRSKIVGKLRRERKQTFWTAYKYSVRSGDTQLIQLNEFIFKKCFKYTENNLIELKEEIKYSQDVDLLINLDTDNFDFENYMSNTLPNINPPSDIDQTMLIRSVQRVVEHIGTNEVKMTARGLRDSAFFVIYYLMEEGYRSMFKTITFVQYDEEAHQAAIDGAAPYVHADLVKPDPIYNGMVAYFDKLSVELRRELYASDIFYKDLLGVIFLYATY